MDIKNWIMQTGITSQETLFIRAPTYPYIVYFDSQKHSGADLYNFIITHNIRLELYSEQVDQVSEKKIESLLEREGIEYEEHSCEYIESERHFMKVYEFVLMEKKRE